MQTIASPVVSLAAVDAGSARLRAQGWRHVCNGTDWRSGEMFTVWRNRDGITKRLSYPQIAAH